VPYSRTDEQIFKYLYGPVPSRRLGFSLGIDIIPHKNCSFDCIYCQLGSTTNKTTSRREYTPVREILNEIKIALTKNERIDYMTFSGSGEPTLHTGIGQLIDGVKTLTTIPTAVLTNGSLLHLPDVRNDLIHADVVLPTLCAANQMIFAKIHRGAPQLDIKKIIAGYIDFRRIFKGKIWLELMILKDINDSPDHIMAMKSVIQEINPDKIHLNTVIRPPSEKCARPVSAGALRKIKMMLGSNCEIIAEFKPRAKQPYRKERTRSILSIIQRRPVTIDDLVEVTGLSRDEITERVERLLEQGKIVLSKQRRKKYYRAERSFHDRT